MISIILFSEIICLDGLCVEQIVNKEEKKYGFEISHKEKVYKSKTFFCKDCESHEIWIDKLNIY